MKDARSSAQAQLALMSGRLPQLQNRRRHEAADRRPTGVCRRFVSRTTACSGRARHGRAHAARRAVPSTAARRARGRLLASDLSEHGTVTAAVAAAWSRLGC